MKNNEENERKYLVFDVPDFVNEMTGSSLIQGYLVVTDYSEVRLRKELNGKTGELTVKKGHGKIRHEYDTELNIDQFDDLWEPTLDNRIKKVRYCVDYKDHLIEVDIYKESLKPLVTAEVEFDNNEASNNFIEPDWFGPEVTLEDEFKNKWLAVNGLPNLFYEYRELNLK